jgi:sulfate adenylyltransferase
MIQPYGGTLVDLTVADPEHADELRRRAAKAAGMRLSPRSTCDLELLATGAFSPVSRFMGEADYRGVLEKMRLASGVLFPIPITLPLPEELAIGRGELLALRGESGELLAVLTVDEIFARDEPAETRSVLGTADDRHPLVAEMRSWPRRYVSGPVDVLRLPHHRGFGALLRTPSEVRSALGALGHDDVVAFQTRNPMHRVHEELTKRAVREIDGSLLIHPVVGTTRPGDIDAETRVRCYTELVTRYHDASRTLLSVLPLAMRMAGPREAVWHAIIRRNYGANHIIIGRDHAGPGRDSSGRPFYWPYDAQNLVRRYQAETGVKALTFEELVYLPEADEYVARSRVNGRRFVAISGTAVRETYLGTGQPLPPWFTRPEVAAILSDANRGVASEAAVEADRVQPRRSRARAGDSEFHARQSTEEVNWNPRS